MTISDSRKAAANVMGGKTARACDGCLRKRARWYCAADDAFLCQACDASVHSANQLASRHERVRLQTASSSSSSTYSKFNNINQDHHDAPPAWHQGFTRKARTPRQHNKLVGQTKHDEGFKAFDSNPLLHPLVPELGSEEGSVEENEEQLLCRVPVFDPFAAGLSNDGDEVGMVISEGQVGTWENMDADGFNDLLPSDIDLAEFAADVESLLGVELDEETKPTESLDVGESNNCFKRVKDEEEEEGITEACCFDSALREPLNWSLDLGDEEEEEKGVVPAIVDEETSKAAEDMEMKRNTMLLRLNYESVITAWATQRSPWTTGSRPQFNPDDDFIITGKLEAGDDEVGGAYGGRKSIPDGEREARVSRYREKRRTRLFSKKIRYEVRKLNAEKRPRMKGRFVKRTSNTSFLATNTMPPAFPNYNQLIH